MPNLKSILLLLFWMAVGGAVGKWVAVPAAEGRLSLLAAAVSGGILTALALLAWVLTLSHFLRRVERDNPSELLALGLGTVALSLVAASFLLLSPSRGEFRMLLGAGCVAGFAGAVFRLRAITRKYENKRKAQGA